MSDETVGQEEMPQEFEDAPLVTPEEKREALAVASRALSQRNDRGEHPTDLF
jgi:hypothetical protein